MVQRATGLLFQTHVITPSQSFHRVDDQIRSTMQVMQYRAPEGWADEGDEGGGYCVWGENRCRFSSGGRGGVISPSSPPSCYPYHSRLRLRQFLKEARVTGECARFARYRPLPSDRSSDQWEAGRATPPLDQPITGLRGGWSLNMAVSPSLVATLNYPPVYRKLAHSRRRARNIPYQ